MKRLPTYLLRALLIFLAVANERLTSVSGRTLWECQPTSGACQQCELSTTSSTCAQKKLFGTQQSCSAECAVDPSLSRQSGLLRFYCDRGTCKSCNVGHGKCPNQPLYDSSDNCREHCKSVGLPPVAVAADLEDPKYQCRQGTCTLCSIQKNTCTVGLTVYTGKQSCTDNCSSLSSTKSCGPNQVFSQCGECELKCSTVATAGPLRCSNSQCGQPGCVCREGYARDDRDVRRLCVDPRQCTAPTSAFSDDKRFFCSTSVGSCLDCGGNSERTICPSQFKMYPIQRECETDCRAFAKEANKRFYQCFSDGECHSCEESLGNCVVGVQKYATGKSCIDACAPKNNWKCNTNGNCRQCKGDECNGVRYSSAAECRKSVCQKKTTAVQNSFAWRCVNGLACVQCTAKNCGKKFYLSKSLCEVSGCRRQPGAVKPPTLPGLIVNLPGGSSSSSDCVPNEAHFRCLEWAVKGECETNPFWMKINCQRSCNSCGITILNAGIVPRLTQTTPGDSN